MRDLTFGYPGSEEPVLHGVSLMFLPGQTSAIIGGTGSGKTTLLNLVPRFCDPTSGSVRVNGVDVRDQDLEQLWHEIGMVPQSAFLFSGTVASVPHWKCVSEVVRLTRGSVRRVWSR